jgi:biopolymer transport protein ExbB
MSITIALFLIFSSIGFAANGPNAVKAQAPDLNSAYQKEFMFLASQKRALQKSLNNIEAEYRVIAKRAEADLQKRQQELVGLSANNDILALRVEALQRELEQSEQASQSLAQAIEGAKTTLSSRGVAWRPEGPDAENLDVAFALAENEILKSRRIRMADVNFVNSKGAVIQGEGIVFGDIARFALTPNAGQLIPSGDGRWQLLDAGAESAARLRQGENLGLVELYLFEGPQKGIALEEGKNIVEFIHSGGSVAWVIVALGLVCLGLVIWRAYHLQNCYQKSFLVEGQSEEQLRLLSEQSKKSSVSRFLRQVFSKSTSDKEGLNKAIDEVFVAEEGEIDRLATPILVVAAVAPLLGLLGTVTGMIATFDIITKFGTGDPKLLAGGISEALITTELGLVVAIPALFFGHMLGARSKQIKRQMEQMALRLLAIWEEREQNSSETT